MKKPIITNQLLTQNTIRSRGWTIAQIRHFLGEPDRREARRLLWDARRVQEAESTGEFQAWHLKRELRSQRRQQRSSDASRRETFAKLHPPEPLPATEGFYEALDQIRKHHPYLIGRPILPGKNGEAVIECTQDQYPRLAELLHVHAAHAGFKQHELRISVWVIG